MDIVERLKFDAARCAVDYSKGVASNIGEAVAEIERLRRDYGILSDIAAQLEKENDALRHDLERALQNHVADLNGPKD